MINAHNMLTIIAVDSVKRNTGIKKVRAKKNLDSNVATVDNHICLCVWTFSDSSEIWMPRASDNASATAMMTIPPTTASLEWVPEWSPTISPNVVIVPEVNPKPIPVFNDSVSCFNMRNSAM